MRIEDNSGEYLVVTYFLSGDNFMHLLRTSPTRGQTLGGVLRYPTHLHRIGMACTNYFHTFEASLIDLFSNLIQYLVYLKLFFPRDLTPKTLIKE